MKTVQHNMMKRVAGVVVLYNPLDFVVDNLLTYSTQLEKIFAIDNSEENVNQLVLQKIGSISNIEVIQNTDNYGIAYALNTGARKAINEGFHYLLTMDQDGSASPAMVNALYSIISTSKNIGIVTAEHFNPTMHSELDKIITKEVLYTMTSGNLINLSAYQTVGGFLNELFIDHVDHEYCLRLNKNGYKVFKTNVVLVYHQLGKAEKKKFLGFNLYPTHHPPIRLYYRTRNRCYVNNLYKKDFPEYVKEDRKHFIREVIDMVFCEKDLYKKYKMIIRGYLDYRKKKLGKFENAR